MAGLPIRVIRGVADFTGSPSPQSVVVSLGTTIDVTRSFVRVTGTMHSSAGAIGGQASATTLREFSVRAVIGPNDVRILRPAGGLASQIVAYFEVWEYTGPIGGEHEFKVVAGPYQTAIPNGQTEAIVPVFLAPGVNLSKCVPIMMAQMSALDEQSAQNLHCTLFFTTTTVGLGSAGSVFIQRAGSQGLVTVAWVLVEFSGSAWFVSNRAEVVPGAAKVFEPAVDWAHTIAFSTFRHASPNVNAGSYVLDHPIGTNNQLILSQNSGADTTGARAFVYLLSNPDLEVFHASWITEDPLVLPTGTAGTAQTVTRIATDFAVPFRALKLATTGMIATATVSGATPSAPRQHFAYRISDTDEIQFFRGYAGANAWATIQLVYFEPEAFALLDQATIVDSWTSVENINVAFNDLARSIEAGLAVSGAPSAGGGSTVEIVRVLDTWEATLDQGIVTPPPPESSIDFLRANWSVAVVVETAEVTDVARAGSSAVEERVGLLDRPRRRFGVQMTGIDAARSAEFRVNMTRATQGDFDLPVYSDFASTTASSSGTTIFCSPSDRRFVAGGRFILHTYADGWPTAAQTGTIVTVQSDRLTIADALVGSFPERSRVYPLARCRPVIGMPVVAITDGIVQIDFEARELEAPSAFPARSLPADAQIYRGWPVLAVAPDWGQAPSMSLGREVETENIGTSSYDQFLSVETGADAELAYSFLSRSDAWHALSILESRRGRALPFWALGPQSIGTVLAITASNITVAGDYDTTNVAQTYRYLALQLKGAAPILVDIESVQSPVSGQLVLSFSEDLTLAPPLDQLLRVTPAHLVRMAADVLREEWVTDSICTITLAVEDTRAEPASIDILGFVEPASSATGAVDGTPDLWAYIDSTKNALRAATPTTTNPADPANGALTEAELWPRLDSAVHYWADVRFDPSVPSAPGLRAMVPVLSVLPVPAMRLLRTTGSTGVATGTTDKASLGTPSIVRLGSATHRMLFLEADSGTPSAAPWGTTGVTFFLHMNTPPAALDPLSGAGDIISYLGSSGPDTFAIQLGRIRMFAQELPSASLPAGQNAVYADLFDGNRKLIVYRVELGVAQTLWVDGIQRAITSAPSAINGVDTTLTRWFRWMGYPLGSTTDGPSLSVGTQMQLNAVAVYSRAISIDELNAVGSALAARHGTDWSAIV